MTSPAPSQALAFDSRFARLDGEDLPTPRQIALVPGAAVPTVTLDLPKALTGQAREQVARRQIQDSMGLAPDRIEMRPNLRKSDWQTALLAAPEQLELWRQKAGKARAILPDYLALPTSTGLWTVANTPSGIAARLGPDDGFGAGTAVALTQLEARLEDQNRPKPTLILQLGTPIDGLEAFAERFDLPLVHSLQEVGQTPGMPAPKILGHNETDCDLLRDPGLVRTRLRRTLRAWSLPLVLGSLAAGLWTAANLTETRQLSDETQTITAATTQIVRAHFVPSGPILDIRQQVSRALADVRTQTGPDTATPTAFDLFTQASTSLAAANLQLREVSSDDGKRLDLTVDVADFAAADRLLASLRTQALNAELIESRATDQGASVRARFRLTARVTP